MSRDQIAKVVLSLFREAKYASSVSIFIDERDGQSPQVVRRPWWAFWRHDFIEWRHYPKAVVFVLVEKHDWTHPTAIALQDAVKLVTPAFVNVEVRVVAMAGHNLEAILRNERRATRHQFWYAMKAKLGAGEQQQILNAVHDELAETNPVQAGW